MKTSPLVQQYTFHTSSAKAVMAAAAGVAAALLAALLLGVLLGNADWSLPVDPAIAAIFTA